jgi:rare lipoprotein A
LRLQLNLRALSAWGVVAIGALALVPSVHADTEVKITNHRLHVIAGHKARVNGELAGASGREVRLERRAGHGWHVEDDARTNASGRFALAFSPGSPGSASLRVRFPAPQGGVAAATPGVGPVVRGVGRLNVYRKGTASVYGPGGSLACGGSLSSSTLGVANKTLPCGTKVTFRYGNRSVRVPVIDRGPYVGGRDWDLTTATAKRLGFPYGVDTVLSTR